MPEGETRLGQDEAGALGQRDGPTGLVRVNLDPQDGVVVGVLDGALELGGVAEADGDLRSAYVGDGRGPLSRGLGDAEDG